MFTLKFYRNNDDGSRTITSLSAPHYEVLERANSDVVSVAVHKDFTEQNGVERHLSSNARDYDVCFVENAAGKTVACIKPQA